MSRTTRVCPFCLREMEADEALCPLHKAAPDPLIGQVIAGSYRLARRSWQAGRGTGYLGEDLRLGRRIAVEIYSAAEMADEAVARRVHLGVKTLGSLAHEHLVTVHDVQDLDDGGYAVIKERLRGELLSERIEGERGGKDAEPVSLNSLSRIIGQTAMALGATHARDLVHRNVTPDNIMLLRRSGRDDFVKLMNFGLVKRRRPVIDFGMKGGTAATGVGEVVGTPHYMSPEQVRTEAVDHRADIYALGMVAYATACGRPAFDGRVQAVMMAQVTKAPTPPREHRDDLPEEAEKVILRALAKAPDDRYAAVEAFASALSRALQDNTGVRQIMAMEETVGRNVPAALQGISLDD